MQIRNIQQVDTDAILELNELSVSVLSPLDLGKLERLIDSAHISKVLDAENSEGEIQVAAFLLAFTQDSPYESVNYQWFNRHYTNFLYIDRIVVSAQFRGKGIGTKLYDWMIEQAQKLEIRHLVAEIDILPPNHASLVFHQKYDFAEVEQLKHSESKVVSLQAKSIP